MASWGAYAPIGPSFEVNIEQPAAGPERDSFTEFIDDLLCSMSFPSHNYLPSKCVHSTRIFAYRMDSERQDVKPIPAPYLRLEPSNDDRIQNKTPPITIVMGGVFRRTRRVTLPLEQDQDA